MANDTSGHESEFINVQDLKAALQKFKTDKVDVKVTGPASSTDAHVAVFDGATGKIVKDSGFTIAKSVPSNAVFTDTTYSSEAAASGGTDVSLCTTGEKYTWNNKLSASIFTNNNKGTSVGKIMVADASNGLGYSTPSDLASVLGVIVNKGHNKVLSDANTWRGNFYCDIASTTVANTPGDGIYINLEVQESVRLQLNYHNNRAKFRLYWFDTWTEWRTMY